MTRGPCTSTTSTRLSGSTKARSAVTSIKSLPNCALPVGRNGEVVRPGFADQERQRLVALPTTGLPSESSASTRVQGSGFKTRRLKNGSEGRYRARTTAQPADGE